MDMSKVGPLRGRKVAPLPHYLSKRLTKEQKKVIRRNGGLGLHSNRVGAGKKMVNITNTDQGHKVAVYEDKQKRRRNLTSHQQEYQDMMVRIMERESSGKHPRVKPTASKRAKTRLKDYVDHGCPVQGVDV